MKGTLTLDWSFRFHLLARFHQIQRQSILQWFAALSTQLSSEELQPLLVPILHPLFRLQQSTNLHVTKEGINRISHFSRFGFNHNLFLRDNCFYL
jgi:hypothetical protein